MILLCYLAAIWSSLRTLALVSGCAWREVHCADKNLSVLRCERCRRWSVGWRWTDPEDLERAKRRGRGATRSHDE